MAEEEKKEEKKKVVTIYIPPINLWMVATIILAVALVFVYLKGFPTTGMFVGVSSQDAANKAVNYINKNLVQSGSVSLLSVNEMSGVYEVVTSYQGQNISVYVTKDGKYLVIGSGTFDMTQEVSTTPASTQEIPKTDKPTLDLYVWAECPYGKQAETLVKPVYDLLKNKVDFNLIFIGPVTDNKDVAAKSCFDGQGKSTEDAVKACCNSYNINGKTIYSCGLHGNAEALESERQACVLKEYGKDNLWRYLVEFDSSGDVAKAITAAGADANKISSCMSSYGWFDILSDNSATANKNGIQGSESILLNGVKLSPANYRWSPEKLKSLICSGFVTQPSECSQTLSEGSASSSSGGCQ